MDITYCYQALTVKNASQMSSYFNYKKLYYFKVCNIRLFLEGINLLFRINFYLNIKQGAEAIEVQIINIQRETVFTLQAVY